MKIIILGAGQVGSSLAEHLVAENHDITVVDINADILTDLSNRLDLRTILGQCSYPDVLRQAGGDNADMVIAVTDSDESNMVACQVAYSLFNVPTKIARVRSPHYFIRSELFGKEDLPIDVFISPEQLVTNEMRELINHPGALQVLDFADGLVKLVAVKPFYGGPLLGKSIADLQNHLPDVASKVVAIFRNERSIPVEDDTVIEIGDELFFIAASEHIQSIMSALRKVEQQYERVFIAGGGNIGLRLAEALKDDYSVKVIERGRERCELVAQQLEGVTVLCGDCSDKELLLNENIEHCDVFCAVTNDDENNIISSMQAKRLGAKQVMAIITRTAYVDLIESSQINIAISPQQATVGSILTHIRRGDIVNVHSLRRGAAEAIEVIAHGDEKTSKVVGRKVGDIKLPSGTKLGAVVREKTVIIPNDETVIESDDHAILFVADKSHIRDAEKLFQVSPGFF